MMKHVLYWFIFAFLVAPLHGQKNRFKTGTPSPKRYYTEIKYETVKGKIIIPVSINSSTYRFLFDTGAPNIITSEIYTSLNISKSNAISVSDANNNKQSMQKAVVPKITIGGVTFKNTSSLVLDSASNMIFDCFEIDGIIGTNLLRKSIVQIRGKQQLIVLTNQSNKLNLDESQAMHLTLKGSQSAPYISIKLRGQGDASEHLLIDTGASGFYDMCKKNYLALKEKKVSVELGSSSGASSLSLFGETDESIQYQVKVPIMDIAGHQFENVITTTGDDDNSRIGSDILDYGNMTLDFRNKRFYFEGFEKENDMNETSFGFTPTIANGKLAVGMVWNDDLKEEISYGDEILKVNNTDLSKMDICDFLTMPSPFKDVEILNISIKTKNGNTKLLRLERK